MKKVSVFGTKEWASSNVNIQNGCPNDCRYCFSKSNALRFGRASRETWKYPVINPDKVSKGYQKRDGKIMFPSSHDITKDNLPECLTVLRKMLEAGNDVLIVSKPDPECIRQLCCELVEFKKQILFRFSIGSANDDVLRFWEPNAPSFKERLEAMKLAFDAEFNTSMSGEPMLDNEIEKVVEAVLPFITDAIWIGLPNHLNMHIARNCGDEETEVRAAELLGWFTDDRIHEIYKQYADHPKIKWKESIKKVVGLELPNQAGLDI